MKIPPGLELVEGKSHAGGWGVFAKTPYKTGEVVFVGKRRTAVVPVGAAQSEPIARVAVRLADGYSTSYIDVIPSQHCVPREPTERDSEHANKQAVAYDVYGFDSFMNHACDPNTTVTWLDAQSYMHVARRDIGRGDEVTVDYAEVYYARAPLHMLCRCAAPGCRGLARYGAQG